MSANHNHSFNFVKRRGVGIGEVLCKEYSGLESFLVVYVKDNGPAWRGGLRSGDRIVSINGLLSREFRIFPNDVEGTEVALVAKRGKGIIEANVVRERFNLSPEEEKLQIRAALQMCQICLDAIEWEGDARDPLGSYLACKGQEVSDEITKILDNSPKGFSLEKEILFYRDLFDKAYETFLSIQSLRNRKMRARILDENIRSLPPASKDVRFLKNLPGAPSFSSTSPLIPRTRLIPKGSGLVSYEMEDEPRVYD